MLDALATTNWPEAVAVSVMSLGSTVVICWIVWLESRSNDSK